MNRTVGTAVVTISFLVLFVGCIGKETPITTQIATTSATPMPEQVAATLTPTFTPIPTPTPKLAEIIVGGVYTGPLIDAHSHIVPGLDADKIISLLDEAGVSQVVLMPRQGAGGPDEVRTLSFYNRYPDRFIPLVAFNVRRWGREQDPAFPSYVERQLKTGKFKGLGEVILRAYREERDPVDYDIPPDGPLTLQIVDLAAKYGVPMIIHHEAEDKSIPPLERMLEHNRKAIVIWGHQGRADADTLKRLLDKHPNLYADMSGLDLLRPYGREKNPIATDGDRLMEKWKNVYETYSDRFMFGAEAAFLDKWEQYGDYVNWHRKILGQLTPEAAEKMAFRNAQKLFALKPSSWRHRNENKRSGGNSINAAAPMLSRRPAWLGQWLENSSGIVWSLLVGCSLTRPSAITARWDSPSPSMATIAAYGLTLRFRIQMS